MIFLQNLSSADEFIKGLQGELKILKPKSNMSNIACYWISFCLTGMIIVGGISWQKFQRASGGAWKARALSWMFHHSKGVPWKYIFILSTSYLLRVYRVKEGHLLIDDLDRARSKKTKNIWGAHKTYNKKGGGFINAQNLVLLVLVTKKITIPVGFEFYRPDPKQKLWRKNDKILKEKGILKKNRPIQPERDPAFPTKKKIAATLLRRFKYYHHRINIKSIDADNAYLSNEMRVECARIYPEVNFNSQIKKTQKVRVGKRAEISVMQFFSHAKTRKKTFNIRGKLEKTIIFASARVYVKSLKRKMHVVAFKYENEDKFRYICGSELSWRAEDIILSYGLRWLVEVVIEDWKLYDGWGQEACQHGIEGAYRGVQLSLLLDHFLLQHPVQRHLHNAGKPLYTVGSLKNQLQLESLYKTIEAIIESDDPKKRLNQVMASMKDLLFIRNSDKHMSGREIGDFNLSPSLLKRFG